MTLPSLLRDIYRFPYACVILVRRSIDLIRVYIVSVRGKGHENYRKISAAGYADVSWLLDEHDRAGFKEIDDALKNQRDEMQAAKGYTRINDFHQSGILPDSTQVKLKKFANRYFGVSRSYIEHTQYQRNWKVEDPEPPGLGYHVDDYGSLLKFFFFLTEVNPNNAPLEVVKGTRGYMGPWRGLLWLWRTDLRTTYFPSDKTSCSDVPINSSQLLCGAGTLFAVDTSSLHTAHKLISGERRVIVITFRPSII